jgi:dTDP-4-amino-4,6-dideoxy-D-galactose acyltransferase
LTEQLSTMETVLAPLPWDSNHFGFPVAKITSPHLGDAALAKVLTEARGRQFRLVYWLTSSSRSVSSSLLLNGILADRRAIFQLDLPPSSSNGNRDVLPASEKAPGARWHIGKFPPIPPTRDLLDLAVSAGSYSRFASDPRIPKIKFVQLYERWMHASTLGEMADQVLVAYEIDPLSDCLGMITFSVTEGSARIGLIAVRENARGMGIGAALIAAAHREMADRGVRLATVFTQCANVPACRLYERMGYRLAEVQSFYHFWIESETVTRSQQTRAGDINPKRLGLEIQYGQYPGGPAAAPVGPPRSQLAQTKTVSRSV